MTSYLGPVGFSAMARPTPLEPRGSNGGMGIFFTVNAD